MSDALHIEQGAKPWTPSSTTELKTVLHRFTIPLVGVIEQDGVTFLFWCVTGHAAPESAWAYAMVKASEVKRLSSAAGDEFDQVLREVTEDRACTFAIASDDKGILASVILNPPASFDTVHQEGMMELGQKYMEMFEEYEAMREAFPLLRKAAQFPLTPTPHAEAV